MFKRSFSLLFALSLISPLVFAEYTAEIPGLDYYQTNTPTIGSTISGGTEDQVLFVGAGSTLDGDPGLTYEEATNRLSVGAGTSAVGTINSIVDVGSPSIEWPGVYMRNLQDWVIGFATSNAITGVRWNMTQLPGDTYNSAFAFNVDGVGEYPIKIETTGEVGINWTAPTQSVVSALAVDGGVTIGNAYTSTNAPPDGLAVKGTAGFGTDAPGNTVHIFNDGTYLDGGLILDATAGISPGIQFYFNGDPFHGFFGVAETAGHFGIDTSVNDFSFGVQQGGNLHFGADGAGGNPTTMVLMTNDGHVAIRGGYSGAFFTPTAWLHLPPGDIITSNAPLKFSDGLYLTTPETGTVEWETGTAENLTFTPVGTRYRIPMVDSGVGGLTSGRVPIATTNGRLTDDAGLTFVSDTLTVTQGTLGNEVARLASTASSGTDPSRRTFENKVLTTNSTATTIHTFAIPATTTVQIKAFVTARRTGGSAGTAEDGAGYEIIAVFKNVAGTATQISISTLTAKEDQSPWDLSFAVSAGNSLLQVSGATNNNISWVMVADVYQVST